MIVGPASEDYKIHGFVDALDSIGTKDPEAAHEAADAILLKAVDERIADAYQRVFRRQHWWASA